MNPKYHVNLDLAKRLAPYLKDKKTEHWWWESFNKKRAFLCIKIGEEYFTSTGQKFDQAYFIRNAWSLYAAPSVGELLEWLPENRVRITKWMGDWYCELYHEHPLATVGEARKIGKTPAEALGLMLEYLSKEKII